MKKAVGRSFDIALFDELALYPTAELTKPIFKILTSIELKFLVQWIRLFRGIDFKLFLKSSLSRMALT